MKKAIFIDYTGTMVQEDEPYTRELLAYFISHSDLKDPKEILKIVWGKVKEIEAESYGDSFVKIDERTDRILQYCVKNCGLNGDACKPNRLIFEKALEISGVNPDEAIHIGDSITSDVEPAKEMGIIPIYISRKEAAGIEGVRVIRTLDEMR